MAKKQKFIFITGGVVSSIGKGLTAASLGTLLESRGLKVSLMKCDPYINVDPGTMSPLQHGEVYVTADGAETDLDLGHYERFTSLSLSKHNSITAGQVYESVIAKERRGDYLGGTVQVIPHITNEIKASIEKSAKGSDVAIIEIGGTVGDIEGLPFIEAIRQMRTEYGSKNTLFVHVTYVPYIAAAGELKSKPTQHSVKELRQVGIQPDFLVCRSEKVLDDDIKKKIGLFCSLASEDVIAAMDSKSIYDVPLALHEEGLDKKIIKKLSLKLKPAQMASWKKVVKVVHQPEFKVTVGVVGKYVELKESYKSLHESLVHGGVANNAAVEIKYIDSDKTKNLAKELKNVDGVLVPGGFGPRGVDGKLKAIKYARENKIPFFGICYGMQLACIEFAKNVCKLKGATSREFAKVSKPDYIIDLMTEQKSIKDKGGTMRLGAFDCDIAKGTKVYDSYKKSRISERHRHRYEFNNHYKNMLESKGLVASGICKERDLVEIVELKKHPWFVGVQFHPEFQSSPLKPHPLFSSFVAASLKNSPKKHSKKITSKKEVRKK